MASARFLGYLEGLAHRAPDRFRLDSLGQGLVHRPAAQAGQHIVPGHAGRVRVAELRAHLLPEHREPHGARVPAAYVAPPKDSYGWVRAKFATFTVSSCREPRFVSS